FDSHFFRGDSPSPQPSPRIRLRPQGGFGGQESGARERTLPSSFASMQRLVAGRAISWLYQRSTLGKSFSSTLWRGWRQAQPRMAKSATDKGPATNSKVARRLLRTS